MVQAELYPSGGASKFKGFNLSSKGSFLIYSALALSSSKSSTPSGGSMGMCTILPSYNMFSVKCTQLFNFYKLSNSGYLNSSS